MSISRDEFVTYAGYLDALHDDMKRQDVAETNKALFALLSSLVFELGLQDQLVPSADYHRQYLVSTGRINP